MKWIQLLIFTSIASASAVDHLVYNPAELKKAAKSAAPGDSIILGKSGQWKDARLKLKLADVTLTVENRNEVAFRGRSSIEIIGRNVTIDGLTFRDGSLDTGHVMRIRGEHCRVTRCSIIDYNPGKSSTRYHWLSLHGHHHRVDHCRFSGQAHSGTTLCVWLDGEEVGHHRIDHNHFGPRARGDGNGFETIRIGTSERSMKDANCIVTHNLFEQCDGEIETVSNKSCGNTYIANTFDRCEGCLTLRHGNRCRVIHNIILGGGKKGTGGIRIVGEDHIVSHNHIEGTDGCADGAVSISAGVKDSALDGHARVRNLLVEGNTLFNNRSGNFCIGHGKGSHDRTLEPIDLKIRNNFEKPASTDRTGYRLTSHDVGPDSKIILHPKAITGTHAVGEVDNLDNTAWIIPSPKSISGIVLDETDAILEGDWQYSTHTPPWVGVGYLHDRKEGKGQKSVTYSFKVPESGRYRVEVSHCYNVRRATNTPITIIHADGESMVRINQQETPPHGKLFRPIGEFRFERQTPGVVRISNRDTSPKKVVIADAIRLVPMQD